MTEPSLKDRLNKILSGVGDFDPTAHTQPTTRAEAAAQILALFKQEVMAALPEKKQLAEYRNKSTEYYLEGFNQCLDDITKALIERLE